MASVGEGGDRLAGWRPLEGRPPLCGERHPRATGWLDETARRLAHPELAVARQLEAEGHRVRALAERPGRGPIADLDVCGSLVEVKSFLVLADRDGRQPTARSVLNKLVAAERQGATAIVFGRGSGLTAAAAAEGVASYGERGHHGKLESIRVLGDGFDLAWSHQRRLARRPAPAERGPDLSP